MVSLASPNVTTTAISAATTAPKLLDVLIVGGGLSGLLVAQGLQQMQQRHQQDDMQRKFSWQLLEARSVLGGRLANHYHTTTASKSNNPSHAIDMGGAWIWPDFQPHMRQLVATLTENNNKNKTFPQPDDPSSTRIVGGAYQFIHHLQQQLGTSGEEDDRIRLNAPVTSCSLQPFPVNEAGDGLEGTALDRDDTDNGDKANRKIMAVRVETASRETYWARNVVFAVPPKVLSQHVTFDPPLSPAKRAAMEASHTWMAGVTKVALVYPTRFWNTNESNMGLSPQLGGPAFQVYDSSSTPTLGNDDSMAALTFFALVKPDNPAVHNDKEGKEILAKQVADQMGQMWNYMGRTDSAKKVHSYTHHYIQRWPLETYVSEDPKPTRIHPHPSPVPELAKREWSGMLHFAGSETDLQSPGVMEGAAGAARRVLKDLSQVWGFQNKKSEAAVTSVGEMQAA